MWNRIPAAVLAASALVLALAVPAAAPNPFPVLEKDIRSEIRVLQSRLQTATGEEDAAMLRNRLVQVTMNLHDIRNHGAFLDLWNRWKGPRSALDVLYVGSGSHVAPIVFLFGKRPLREISMTYTEVDPWAGPRLEQILRRMESIRAITGLQITYEPGGHPAYRRIWRSALSERGGEGLRTNRESFFNWFQSAGAQVGEPAGFRVIFQFQAGGGHATIRLLVRDGDGGKGSTDYYRGEDFARCDLFITHSWRSSPGENLRLLYDAVQSSKLLRSVRASSPSTR